MEAYYRFAGIDFKLLFPNDIPFSESSRLAQFRVDSAVDPHVFRFDVRETLEPPRGELLFNEGGFREYGQGDVRIRFSGPVLDTWMGAYVRVEHKGKQHEVQLRAQSFPDRIGSKAVLQSLWIEHLIAETGGFVFHCSFVERDGKAILFTAPSGVGKSTQADLWNQFRGTSIINGDRSAVCCTDSGVVAAGIPFSGSSAYCENRILPLVCVVYLSQATDTSIRRLRGTEAFLRIWEGCSINTWDREDMVRVSEAVTRVVSTVPVYHLSCTPDESAVIALEQQLRKQD